MDADPNIAEICLYLFHDHLWCLMIILLQTWSIIRGACSQGEHNPLPLMSKGENDVEDLEVVIKSKGGDCWHYDSGLAV